MSDENQDEQLHRAHEWLEQTGLLKLPGTDTEYTSESDTPLLELSFDSVYEGEFRVYPTEPERGCPWKVGVFGQGAVPQYAPTAIGAVRWVVSSVVGGSDVLKTNEASLVDSFKKDDHVYDAYRFGFRLLLVYRVESPGEINEATLLPFDEGRLLVCGDDEQYQDGKAWYAGPKRSIDRLSDDEIQGLQMAADWN